MHVRLLMQMLICGMLWVCCVKVHGHDWHQGGGAQAVGTSDAVPTLPPSVFVVVGMAEPQIDAATSEPNETQIANAPNLAKYFEPFANVSVRWDSDVLFVESNGLPEHNMMVGIRSWQQQVPLPQPFNGDNAWQIPLNPKLADHPVSAKNSLFRGAIALAVNGVPIFNALNNRGDDTYLAGELDQWGGHCGRGDDYHYHVAPVHLEEVVGKGNPIAYALDGFPIYGLTDADGSDVGDLDDFNGQFDDQGNYHYHATETYPYINGGLRGEVTVRDDQVEPQPKDAPVRPGLDPLRGAVVTGFESDGEESVLTYHQQGKTGTVRYASIGTGKFKFTFSDPNGQTWSETYTRQSRDNRGSGNMKGWSAFGIYTAALLLIGSVIALAMRFGRSRNTVG